MKTSSSTHVHVYFHACKFATMTTTAVRLQLSRRSRIFLTNSSGDRVYETPKYCLKEIGRCKLAIDPVSGLLSLYSVKSGKIVHSFFVKGSLKYFEPETKFVLVNCSCNSDCKNTPAGADYKGTVSTTLDNRNCRTWINAKYYQLYIFLVVSGILFFNCQ